MSDANQLVIKDKMTLPEILAVFDAMDNGLMKITKEQMVEMGEKASLKIDHWKDFFDRCDSEATRMLERAHDFQTAAGKIIKAKENAAKAMMIILKRGKTPIMSGNDWVVKIKKSTGKKVKAITEEEPDSGIFARHPEFIRRTYAWNVRAIGDSLKSDYPDPWLENRFAITTTENEKIDWSVRKGIES